jgi:anti-sigma factor RsiW
VRIITDYLEDALPQSERRRFEAHLSECDGCTTYLEQMRDTIRAAGTISPESLDPVARESLLAAFRDWNHARG